MLVSCGMSTHLNVGLEPPWLSRTVQLGSDSASPPMQATTSSRPSLFTSPRARDCVDHAVPLRSVAGSN